MKKPKHVIDGIGQGIISIYTGIEKGLIGSSLIAYFFLVSILFFTRNSINQEFSPNLIKAEGRMELEAFLRARSMD